MQAALKLDYADRQGALSSAHLVSRLCAGTWLSSVAWRHASKAPAESPGCLPHGRAGGLGWQGPCCVWRG